VTRRVWTLALLIAGFALPGEIVRAAPSGAWMTVSGTVLAIDRGQRLLVLRHGPMETAPGGVVRCAIADPRFLGRVHRGDWIDGLARTDRHPWLLRDAHIRTRPASPGIDA
jgi:hypothetical protein